MAVLQKLREKAGVTISIIIAIGLLLFIVSPDDLARAWDNLSSKNEIGEIGGKKISYQDFQEDVEYQSTIFKILSGSNVQDEKAQTQIRDAAWGNLLDKYMFIENAKAAGINVGEEEMLSLTRGENPSPLISGNPIFADENGNYSSAKVVEFVKGLSSAQSPEASMYWDFVKNQIYTQRFKDKYSALYMASCMPNALQVKKDVEEAVTADIDYVMKPFSMEKDSTIVVPDSELKAFYKAHKKNFKRPGSRDIEYVVFEAVPSVEDREAVRESFSQSFAEFATVNEKNVASFMLRNSDSPYSSWWYKPGELAADIDSIIFKHNYDMTPVLTGENDFRAAKVIASSMIPDSVYVRHILLRGPDAGHIADSLLAELKKGQDFSLCASTFSEDKQSAADGQTGNIGWMTQSGMVPGYESVLTAQVGVPYIQETDFGTSILEVTKRTAPIARKQVALMERAVNPSNETVNGFFNDATKFASLAGESYEGFRKAVDSMKIYAHPMDNVLESTSAYGAVDKAKELTRKVFEAKKGKCTPIVTLDNHYFIVAAVKDVHEEGTIPFNEIKEQISNVFYAQKYAAKEREEVSKLIAGKSGIEDIAKALGTEVTHVSDMSLTVEYNPYMQANEPALIGAATAVAAGKTGKPVSGMGGTYVVRVNSKGDKSFYTAEDVKQKAQQKAQMMLQGIAAVMMQNADVKDNRARFY